MAWRTDEKVVGADDIIKIALSRFAPNLAEKSAAKQMDKPPPAAASPRRCAAADGPRHGSQRRPATARIAERPAASVVRQAPLAARDAALRN